MKIRTGFVSNSSSSSFLIVGINHNLPWKRDNKEAETEHLAYFNSIKAKLLSSGDFKEPEDDYYPIKKGEKDINMYGDDDDVYYIGMDIEKYIKAGKTYAELISLFIAKMRNLYGIHISLDNVDLYYGEVGSG